MTFCYGEAETKLRVASCKPCDLLPEIYATDKRTESGSAA